MENEIVQNRLFIKRKLKILETKIEYESTSFGKKNGASIFYEDLTSNKDSHFQSNHKILIPVFVSLGFTLISLINRDEKGFDSDIWILWVSCFVIFFIPYVLTIENLWKIKTQSNTYIFLFKAIPNENEVDDFIKNLFDTRNKYLRDTYLYEPSIHLTFEAQINNFQWLRKNEIIDANEFEQLKKQLDVVFKRDVRKVGFI